MKQKKQRIDEDVSDIVVFVKKWVWFSKKQRYDFSDTIRYVFNEFIDSHNIIRKADITEQEIKINHNHMVKYRVDTNIPIELRDDIKIIQYAMNKDKKKEEKRVTIEEVIQTIVDKYMELYPEIKQLKNQDKYLIQKIRLEEVRRKREGLDPDV